MTGTLPHVRPGADCQPARPHSLVDTISGLGHLIEHRIDQGLNALSLTARQYQALTHVAHTPGLSRGALSRQLRVTPQAAGALARRLREADLVHYADAAPGLPVAFTITDSGRASLAEAASIVATTNRSIVSLLPEVTVDCLVEAMRTLTNRLDMPLSGDSSQPRSASRTRDNPRSSRNAHRSEATRT